jgi:hypothetical protein
MKKTPFEGNAQGVSPERLATIQRMFETFGLGRAEDRQRYFQLAQILELAAPADREREQPVAVRFDGNATGAPECEHG